MLNLFVTSAKEFTTVGVTSGRITGERQLPPYFILVLWPQKISLWLATCLTEWSCVGNNFNEIFARDKKAHWTDFWADWMLMWIQESFKVQWLNFATRSMTRTNAWENILQVMVLNNNGINGNNQNLTAWTWVSSGISFFHGGRLNFLAVSIVNRTEL